VLLFAKVERSVGFFDEAGWKVLQLGTATRNGDRHNDAD
jgi:hypothetical protein